MYRWWIGAAASVGLVVGVVTPLAAQQRPNVPGSWSIVSDTPDSIPQPILVGSQKSTPAFEHDPDLDAQDQLSPSQVPQQIPDAVAMPSGSSHTHSAAHGGEAVPESGGALTRAARAAKPDIVACSGVFAQDSSHLKLAAAFQSRNVVFTQVDASSGGKAMASVLYGKDPKRRLEVWWAKPASRSDTHLIVINGHSDWIAPGELHLGLTLEQLEKLNGKAFKVTGFDKDRVATLTDWDGGLLSSLQGGCKVGINLVADAKAAAALSGLPADRAFSSSDASLRAANPTVSEILIAY